jgi:hepatocyte growth factor-regulated tyrosine kinase substrate
MLLPCDALKLTTTFQPPEWVDSDVCMRCRTPFTFTNRKHHCRNCGSCFDQQCSSKSLPLPHLGILQPVRVDDGCYAKLTDKSPRGGGGGAGHDKSPGYPTFPHKSKSSTVMQPRNARVEDSFDEDLKKALAMSLEEVRSHSRGYTQQSVSNVATPTQAKVNGNSSVSKPTAHEEEDEDLKAAIAASLADMEEQKKRHAAALKEQANNASTSAASAPFTLPKNDYELTPMEAENISLFSTLVDRLQTQPPGTILREPQIQELYDSIGQLRPKLARTYGETMSKHGKSRHGTSCIMPSLTTLTDTLLDLHAKLSTVVRYYDRILEERLSKAYSQHSLGGYNIPAPRQPSAPYPSLQAASVPIAGGPAESFYTGQPQHDYSQPSQPQPYLQQARQNPQPQFAAYDKRASMAAPSNHQYPPQQPQRTESWRSSADPAQTPQFNQQQGYPSNEAPTPQPAQARPVAQQGHLGALPPSESVGTTPTTDPTASFYFNQTQSQAQQAPSAPPSDSPYPNLQQASHVYQPSLPQTPAQAPAQPSQPVLPQHVPQAQPTANSSAPYWSHPAAARQHVPAPAQAPPQPQAWPQAPQTDYNNYAQQEAFPEAPHHAPKQPLVEESLIDL